MSPGAISCSITALRPILPLAAGGFCAEVRRIDVRRWCLEMELRVGRLHSQPAHAARIRSTESPGPRTCRLRTQCIRSGSTSP
jgi:hypothetical protein